MWKRWLVSLRIKERVDGYEVEGEEADGDGDFVVEEDDGDDIEGMESEEYDVDGLGGGFFAE